MCWALRRTGSGWLRSRRFESARIHSTAAFVAASKAYGCFVCMPSGCSGWCGLSLAACKHVSSRCSMQLRHVGLSRLPSKQTAFQAWVTSLRSANSVEFGGLMRMTTCKWQGAGLSGRPQAKEACHSLLCMHARRRHHATASWRASACHSMSTTLHVGWVDHP